MQKRKIESMTDQEKKEIWDIVFTLPHNRLVNPRIKFYEACEEAPERWVVMSGYERLGIQADLVVWADTDLRPIEFNKDLVNRWFIDNGFI